jgi:hypothetical protein
MPTVAWLWRCEDENIWRFALRTYWLFVGKNRELEDELESLGLAYVQGLDAKGWYNFLLDKYFRWKFTPNRYATSSRHLRKCYGTGGLERLFHGREDLLSFDRRDIKRGLDIARDIPGLGTAGASGLLALMFPQHFGTVDQFVVKALRRISDLEQAATLEEMHPEDLSIDDGVCLISIMRDKAADDNRRFDSNLWTPRRIDMILWAYGHEEPKAAHG